MRRMSLTSRAVHCSSRGDLLGGRLAAELLNQLALHVHDLVELLDHVHGDPDRAGLVRDRAGHGLPDPPGGVRGELVPAPVVELLDGPDQPERSLLDQVEERQPAAQVALRDRHDQAQVGLDHLLLGDHVAALDPLGEEDLLVRREQLDAPDRPQVEPQRVQARLDRQVDLGLARGRLGAVPVDLDQSGRAIVAGDDLHAVFLQVGVELEDLLLGELDLLERRRDLLEGEVAALLADGHEPAHLIYFEERRLVHFHQQRNSLVLLLRQPRAPLTNTPWRFRGESVARFGCVSPRGRREGLSRWARYIWRRRAEGGQCTPLRAFCPKVGAIQLAVAMNEHAALLGPDVQARRPSTGVSLSRVGVTGVEKIIRIQSNGRRSLFYAELECFVDLGPEQKGAHMSRFEEVVNEAIDEVVLGEAFKAETLASHIAERVRDRQDGCRAEVTIAARYPENKPAPVSGVPTQEIYTMFGSAVASASGTRRLVGVQAQGMTACPCAQEMVTESSRERLRADGFSDDEIDAHLRGRPGGHAQPARHRHAAHRLPRGLHRVARGRGAARDRRGLDELRDLRADEAAGRAPRGREGAPQSPLRGGLRARDGAHGHRALREPRRRRVRLRPPGEPRDDPQAQRGRRAPRPDGRAAPRDGHRRARRAPGHDARLARSRPAE